LDNFKVQKDVIFALLIREAKTRFGSEKLGYLWAFLEPILHVTILSLIFSLVGRIGPSNINYSLFIMTGILPWLLFSNILTKGMKAIASNESLFSYKQVKPIDTIISRSILELLISFSSFFLISLFLIAYFKIIPDSFLLLTFSYLLLTVFAFSLALIISIISFKFLDIFKLVPLFMRPLYFASGIFFSVSILPSKAYDILFFNPILHFIELFRYSFFGLEMFHVYSLQYLLISTLVLLFLGLGMYWQKHKTLLL
jgi:capsular polysaccharide transport system permease protein